MARRFSGVIAAKPHFGLQESRRLASYMRVSLGKFGVCRPIPIAHGDERLARSQQDSALGSSWDRMCFGGKFRRPFLYAAFLAVGGRWGRRSEPSIAPPFVRS